MKKVYFVIASLRAGGAERACVEIIRAIDSRRFDLHIVLYGYPLDCRNPYMLYGCFNAVSHGYLVLLWEQYLQPD